MHTFLVRKLQRGPPCTMLLPSFWSIREHEDKLIISMKQDIKSTPTKKTLRLFLYLCQMNKLIFEFLLTE